MSAIPLLGRVGGRSSDETRVGIGVPPKDLENGGVTHSTVGGKELLVIETVRLL